MAFQEAKLAAWRYESSVPQHFHPPALTLGHLQRQHFERASTLKLQAIAHYKFSTCLSHWFPVQAQVTLLDLIDHIGA